MSLLRRPFVVALGALPLLVDWIYRAVLHPRPFWAFLYDPEMIYVQEGLRLLSGHAPDNIHNPGAPVQVATAAIELFVGRLPESIDAIRLCGYVVALLLSFGAAVLLEGTLFKETPAPLAIAGLWTFFMAPQALEYGTIWSPEILFFAVGTLTLAALSSRKTPVLVGLSVGLCIATKFVFLAWVPALLAVIVVERRRIRDVALGAVGIILGFIAATLPAAGRYHEMAKWLWGITTHSGWYGRGPAELPSLYLTLAGYWNIAIAGKAWLLWCAIVVGLLLLARRRDRGLIVFGSVSIVFSILMAVRTPTGRYLLPGALGIVALVGAVREIRPRLAAVAFVLALAVVGSAVVSDCRSHDRLIAEQSALRAEIDRAVTRVRKPGDIVVFGWRTPQPSFALRFLAFEKNWIAETERLYPHEGHFDVDARRFHLPAGATRWNVLVLDRGLLGSVPEPVIAAAPDVGRFAIVRPARP
ncbi:MAG TPA: hypothetical protein VGQ36_10790 [Thermoanaerobaculia bacterium]|nr:hypothetical protein [Thermoanaerobaculia bacterium]